MTRRRGQKLNPREFANDPEMLELLRSMGIRINHPAAGSIHSAPQDLLSEWEDSLDTVCEDHGRQSRLKGERLRGSMKLLNVRPEGGCEVEFVCAGKRFRGTFELDVSAYSFSITCSCSHGDLCEHTWYFANQLRLMLQNPKSELVRMIQGETTSDLALQQTFTMLQALARNARHDHQSNESPAESEKPLSRYVWDVSTDHYSGSLDVNPCLQVEKKNGGWTKGRECSLETFLQSNRENWTDADQRIVSLIRQERWQNPTISLPDLLRVLAGTDQFFFEREAFELSVAPLEIIVSETEEGLRLSTSATDLAAQASGNAQILDAVRGVLAVLPDQKRAVFFSGPVHSSQICTQLLKNRSIVPDARKEDLLKELEPLKSCMPVRLPESIAGRELIYAGIPVLMLHLRRNGTLDASILIRDRNQMLQTPGEGLARIHEQLDGQPVQHVRDQPGELMLAAEIAETLSLRKGVPLARWSWRIADPDQISSLLSATGELVEHEKMSVVWHKDSVSRFDVIGRLTAQNVRVDVKRQRDWFGLSGTCHIGNQEIPLKELLAGIHGRSMNGMIEVSPGKWAAIATELSSALKRLSDVSLETRGKLQLDASAAPVMSALEAVHVRIESDKHWDKCLQRLQDATETVHDPPAGLNAQLRDYQLDGFRWLCRLSHWGIGGILADDMGLGKTVQTLALLLTRMESGPALVIAPTSLGFNWQRECERFAPTLTPILFRDIDRVELKEKAADGDLVICSYGLALREAELLKEIRWGTLILDEAQNIKNSNSKTAAQIRTFQADWKVALTGTPMENHLGELWSIFHTVAPGVLGAWEQFRRRFAGPIEKDRNTDRCEALSKVISPFVLRRSKNEVLKDLPERTETSLLVDLSAEERQRYDQMRLAAVGELEQIGDDNLSHDQRFRVLQMLTRLRQLSCHIGLVDESWKGSSSKLQVLMEQLTQLKERGHRPLIFSQFTSHLALIRTACDEAGITYQYLDGQTTPAARQERVEAFQNGEGDAFLISLKAGGTGLNLTAADYVIHMDPWWNPAVEDQATDRAHRIGQTKPVMVYRIIARGTIEEQILKLHDEKRDLVDGVLSGADAAARLSTRELAEMIRQGVESPGRVR
jgi:superfamily II DNA or RNA helicase